MNTATQRTLSKRRLHTGRAMILTPIVLFATGMIGNTLTSGYNYQLSHPLHHVATISQAMWMLSLIVAAPMIILGVIQLKRYSRSDGSHPHPQPSNPERALLLPVTLMVWPLAAIIILGTLVKLVPMLTLPILFQIVPILSAISIISFIVGFILLAKRLVSYQ